MPTLQRNNSARIDGCRERSAGVVDVSIVIVSYNTRELLKECLETLSLGNSRYRTEVFVVDNASKDQSPDFVELHHPDVKLIRSRVNLGFGPANNAAISAARGRYVLLLNSDAFLTPAMLDRAIELMDLNSNVGIGGAKLVHRDNSWQPSARGFPTALNYLFMVTGLGDRFGKYRPFGDLNRTWCGDEQEADVDWLTGAFMVIRASLLEQVGLFDPTFFLYYEEVDLCRRARDAGHIIRYWPELSVVHAAGASSKTVEHLEVCSFSSQLTVWSMRSALLYFRKHHGWKVNLIYAIETGWHSLRALFQSLRPGKLPQRKKRTKPPHGRLYASGVGRHLRGPGFPETAMVTISVVVIGRNEGARLRACLQSVFASSFPGDSREVIYVDSNSTDGSVELARQLGARVISFNAGPYTAARARNAGWRSAKGDLVLFLDGDTLLESSFTQEELHRFVDPNLAAVFGQRRESNPGLSVYNRVLDLDWNPVPGRSLYFGGDTLVRRACLEAVGGYREDLIAGEEPELCRRMRQRGWYILHVDRLMTLHDLALKSWRQYWRRAFRTGHAYAQISSLSANTDDPLWVRESKFNIVRGLFWMGLPSLAVVLSAFMNPCIPLGAAVLISLTLLLRSASKSSHKTRERSTLLLYAAHSHLQQIPILLGQLSFWSARATRKQRQLIEYKGAA